MNCIRQKIREEITKSSNLRNLAKDEKLNKEKSIDIYVKMENINDKIRFLRGLSDALLKEEKNEQIKEVHTR